MNDSSDLERIHEREIRKGEAAQEIANDDRQTESRVIKSYVWHGRECFFVSTIERDSSAAVSPPPFRYNETIAWRYDWAKRERGEMVIQSESSKYSIQEHLNICASLFEKGTAV